MKFSTLSLALLLALFSASMATNPAETEYVVDGNMVYFYVYRVHNQLQMLSNDNAASPGGEIGFLSNEFGYQNGIISRDCVGMYNQEFSSYDCCNGGSCSNCGYDGSGSGSANMPGRSFQLYPPPGAPCTQTTTGCSGLPAQSCTGECSGWWYSFTSNGQCTNGQTPTATGCTWFNSPIMQTIQFSQLTASGKFFSCELSQYNPTGGCSGNLAWTPFMSSVNAMLDIFKTSSVGVVLNPTTGVASNLTVPAVADPHFQCKAPCPAGSSSPSGFYHSTAPCQYCPVGTYSSAAAQNSCSPCPQGFTTPSTGATSSAQCSISTGVNTDADADADGQDASFMTDNASGESATARSGKLPTYATAIIVVASIFVAVGAAIVAARVIRSRRDGYNVELVDQA